MTPKKQSYWEQNKELLKSSVKKIDKWILISIALDIVFYIIIIYSFIFWNSSIQAKSFSILSKYPSDPTMMTASQLQNINLEAKSFLMLLYSSVALLALFIIFITSIVKGIIWAKTTSAKINIHLISRFLGLNLIWMGLWTGIIVLIGFAADKTALVSFASLLIVIALYFTNIIYSLFMKNNKISSITDGLKLGVSKISEFAIPNAAVLFVIYLIINSGNLVNAAQANAGYINLAIMVVLIAFIAFARYYTSTLVYQVQKTK
ncbi:MAG TPA: hypothetical protein VJI97_00135 [Candidatus Nanoarchaeia archaeon]|nr:hypothetical protein [Candidatus Nanoarchaeia archaeon]